MAKRRRDPEFWESGQMNNRWYAQYYDRLVELATSMFEWTNLPNTVDDRYLELVLFSHGQAVFFKDDVMGYLALSNMNQGDFDVYRVPKRRRAYGGNGYQCPLDENNSVIIYNNYLRKPSIRDARNYAEILYDLDRSIMVNAKAQKTPILLACDESERLSMMNLYQKYDGNQPFIYGTKDIRPNSIQAISTGAPFVGKELYELKTKFWNEALTALGISNINVQKKERLVSDEVTRMMGGTIASRYSRLEMRRKACKKINDMFGLNIDCNFREDFREADDETMFQGDTGGGGMKNQVIDLRTK